MVFLWRWGLIFQKIQIIWNPYSHNALQRVHDETIFSPHLQNYWFGLVINVPEQSFLATWISLLLLSWAESFNKRNTSAKVFGSDAMVRGKRLERTICVRALYFRRRWMDSCQITKTFLKLCVFEEQRRYKDESSFAEFLSKRIITFVGILKITNDFAEVTGG